MKKGNKAFCVLCYEPCNSGIYYFTQILLLQVVTQIKTRLDKAAEFKKQDADFSHLSCAQGAWIRRRLYCCCQLCFLRGEKYAAALLEDLDGETVHLTRFMGEIQPCMESKDEAEAGASVHRQSFNISNLWRNPASLVPITA